MFFAVSLCFRAVDGSPQRSRLPPGRFYIALAIRRFVSWPLRATAVYWGWQALPDRVCSIPI